MDMNLVLRSDTVLNGTPWNLTISLMYKSTSCSEWKRF